MLLLLLFAFISGLVTILAPCIWPLLPIVLSSSLGSKGHKRPLGITLGIMLSFTIFTLTISALVKLFHFDPNILRIAAVIVISILGVAMIFPAFNTIVELLIYKVTGRWSNRGQGGKGFTGGFITGLSLGIVWSPCAGPILAAIAALAATGQITGSTILITLAYIIGIGIPLFAFAYGGQKVIVNTRFLSKHTRPIQQIFGVVMILTAISIYTNYDTYLLNQIPDFSSIFNPVINNKSVTNELNNLRGSTASQQNSTNLFNENKPAPDFTGITKWLNTDKSLDLQQLRGKVVLVDFWTYTCINCIRTLPHVTSWYDMYHTDGFVVIGVHTPEFQFEHDTSNVENAIKQFNIHYPVAQDNDYATWNAYNNAYWPAEYLIDAKGVIRRTEFGEGQYGEMEKAIQILLKENGKQVNTTISSMPDTTPQTKLSPETYVGLNRMEYYFPSGKVNTDNSNYTLGKNISPNSFTVGGTWNFTNDQALTGKDAVLEYNFTADKVFLVLRPGSANPQGAKVKVLLDGKDVNGKNAGDDVQNGIINVTTDRLYNLINLHGSTENHLLHLEFINPGTEVYAFTFG